MNKTKPFTSYILIIGLFLVCIANMIILIINLYSKAYSIVEPLYCFFISWTTIPYFILSFLKDEFILIILLYTLILLIIISYLLLAIVSYKKNSKTINGALILIIFIDIILSFPMLFSTTIIGIINIAIKCLLILLCINNIKWFNNNYDIK